ASGSARGEDRSAGVVGRDAGRLLVIRRDDARVRGAGEDLGDEALDVDAGKQVKPALERGEERVVMSRNDQLRVERAGEAADVVLRAAAAGEASEEDVGSLALELGVDEVGAAVVVNRDAGRLEEEAEGAAHLVVPDARRRRSDPDLARERHPPEDDPAVAAR